MDTIKIVIFAMHLIQIVKDYHLSNQQFQYPRFQGHSQLLNSILIGLLPMPLGLQTGIVEPTQDN